MPTGLLAVAFLALHLGWLPQAAPARLFPPGQDVTAPAGVKEVKPV
jgi:hypothetical protein